MPTELRSKVGTPQQIYNASGLSSGGGVDGSPVYNWDGGGNPSPGWPWCTVFLNTASIGSARSSGANIQIYFRRDTFSGAPAESTVPSRPPDVTFWLPADTTAQIVAIRAPFPHGNFTPRVVNNTGQSLGSTTIHIRPETDEGYDPNAGNPY
jgi:hypothetical protein